MKRIWFAGLLAIAIIIGGAATVTARQAHPAAFRGSVHVVQPGESLWGIAHKAYPGSDARDSIDRIERANRMRSAVIVPGQRLLIPAP